MIDLADVQQMLRLGGDQVRIAVARELKRFVSSKDVHPPTQFSSAVRPFLARVWPPDQTLRSSLLSDALAELPAATGSAFPAAVAAIADLIGPFDAWSLHSFGFYPTLSSSDRGERGKTTMTLNADEAAAWLRLLDLSIGRGDGAIYPQDLATGLDAIAAGDPRLIADPRYQRLIALLRR